MKVYKKDSNIDPYKVAGFSTKEADFVGKYARAGKLNELINAVNFALWGDTDDKALLANVILGAGSGALSSGLLSSKEKRKKSVLKGTLLGGAAGAANAYFLPNIVVDKIGSVGTGGLAGYLAALHEDSY